MLSLTVPGIAPGEIYDLASERFLDPNFRQRLASARPSYLDQVASYGEKGRTHKLHEIPEGNPANGLTSSADLVTLYDQGLLRRRSKARLLYEEIRLSTPYNICPYCNHRNVGQLDHFLAKGKFPIFSVCPENLIPSCSDCNKVKQDKIYESFVDAPLHPYFDYFEGVDWLTCSVEQFQGGWVGKFEINNAELHEHNVLKLRNHFSEFGLWELYTIQATTELARQAGLVNAFRESGGIEAVRDYLEKSLTSFRSFSNNHWRTALARGCLNDEAYLAG
ncbi:hypothetical protein [Tsuneonella sp. SYSU-LHT278]|uniref:hypothetical protein n=1 Tax=Tsuneonella sediminis TaxID=3416089 RepID=UPI003F7A0681